MVDQELVAAVVVALGVLELMVVVLVVVLVVTEFKIVLQELV